MVFFLFLVFFIFVEFEQEKEMFLCVCVCGSNLMENYFFPPFLFALKLVENLLKKNVVAVFKLEFLFSYIHSRSRNKNGERAKANKFLQLSFRNRNKKGSKIAILRPHVDAINFR
jgi:hypothetical protein